MDGSNKVVFYVNGKKVELINPDPSLTLLHFLRNDCILFALHMFLDFPPPLGQTISIDLNNEKVQLKGAKSGCSEGGCGSCTVMLSKCDRRKGQIRHFTVVACVTSVCQMHGLAVTTVEALGSTRTRLHPVQERLAAAHGSQCGFCTPGMVMSMYTLLRNNPVPSREDIEQELTGNLCRCTGYRSILAGFASFSKEAVCGMGDACCKVQGEATKLKTTNVSGLDKSREYLPYDPSQEPIFPPELKISDAYDKQLLVINGEKVTWYRPTSLSEAMEIKQTVPAAQFIGGASSFNGYWKGIRQRKDTFSVISTSEISELTCIVRTESGLTFGSAVTLSQMIEEIHQCLTSMPETDTRIMRALTDNLDQYASKQVRNVATVGGSIFGESDLNTILRVSGAKVHRKRFDNSKGDDDSLIMSVEIPLTTEHEFCKSYKVADRRHLGSSYVNASFRVKFIPQSDTVSDFAACFSSSDDPAFIVPKTIAALSNQNWNIDSIRAALDTLRDEASSVWKKDSRFQYKCLLTTSLLFKFYNAVRFDRQNKAEDGDLCSEELLSISREPSFGTQVCEEVNDTQSETDAVGRPIVHRAAFQQTTGEAVYCDDITQYQNELIVVFVTSAYAHANLLSVDASSAETMPGVTAYVSHKDVPGSNNIGAIFPDEEVFAREKVHYQGQIIGAVVADTRENAAKAANAVNVEYQVLKPILTIEDAIDAGSFLKPVSSKTFNFGDVDAGLAESDHVISGEVSCGAQEHMALDTMAAICVPTGESNEMVVHTNTQDLAAVQKCVCSALDVKAHKVIVKVKRIGGGFGGKEGKLNLVCAPTAVAAARLNKPVRCVLSREEETLIKGTRHPVLAKYKIGASKDGKLLALDVDVYFNCGHSNDYSIAIAECFLNKLGNAYYIPNIRAKNHFCRTNLHSATAFRGFGTPQAVFVTETIVAHLAEELNKKQHELAYLNLFKPGDLSSMGYRMDDSTVRRCYDECLTSAEYHARTEQIRQFNKTNRWVKKGIAMSPVAYAVLFNVKFLNQGAALVHIYTDGSVMVHHGGVEMGQGLHTKLIQIASRELQISIENVHIMETCTSRVPNGVVSAGSMTTDVYGGAVMNACKILKERLEPYRKSDNTWEERVSAAYFDQVSLSATGFYKINCDDYNWETYTGSAYWYYTNGAACSEVMVDCLTGEHTVSRVDIVMDVGRSLNPAIDIGQIEGAFLQGYGYLTMEEMRYSDQGDVLSLGPNSYKIPGVKDVPVKMNVSLLKGSTNLNAKAVYSSKGIGEPPLLLANSVFFAIKDAITAARFEVGVKGYYRLDAPATAEKIRLSCLGQIQ